MLGTNNVHDALPRVTQTEQRYVAFSRIGLKIAYHCRDFGIGDCVIAAARGDIVVGDPERQSRFGYRATPRLHLAEGVK